MSIIRNRQQWVVLPLVFVICTSISGCGEPKNLKPARVQAIGNGSGKSDHDVISADYVLKDEDLSAFQKGRLKNEILDDVHGYGNLDMATLYNGKAILGIGYGIFGGPFSSDDPRGKYVWAIFIDDKFEKLIVAEAKYPKKFGDFDSLIQAIEADPINLEDMRKPVPVDQVAKPQIDLGLTAVMLALGPALFARYEIDLKRNVVLRSQFNALRLNIGMDEQTVEDTLKAEPLLKGSTAAGTFKIYGSEESLDMISPLHHAIIVTLFSDGKLTGIYSGTCTVPGSDIWRQKLCEIFSDVCP